MTPLEIEALINLNLADASNITPAEHRDVEIALLNYAKLKPSIKVLSIDTFITNRNYSVDTGLATGSIILEAIAMLECKTANNGFAVGDIVTAPTPYPVDSGRTAAQGIGVQFNNLNIDTIKVMVNDQIIIMTAYDGTTDAGVSNISISTSDWKIKLFVNFLEA
jgi:hypothetical protein